MISPRVKGASVTFGPARLCYTSVFEKKIFDGDTGGGKYQTIVLIPKTEKETIKGIKAAIEDAKNNGIVSKWGGKLPKNYRDPLQDGDEKEDDVFAGHWYINAKTSNKPLVLGRDKAPITDHEEIYSGVWAVASVSFYAYNKGGNGVGVTLGGLMKYKDDDRLGGSGSGSTAKADFDAIDLDDENDDDL